MRRVHHDRQPAPAGIAAVLRRLGVGGLVLAASMLLTTRPTFAQG